MSISMERCRYDAANAKGKYFEKNVRDSTLCVPILSWLTRYRNQVSKHFTPRHLNWLACRLD